MILPVPFYLEWFKFERKASFKMRGCIWSLTGKSNHNTFFATELGIVFTLLKVCKTIYGRDHMWPTKP